MRCGPRRRSLMLVSVLLVGCTVLEPVVEQTQPVPSVPTATSAAPTAVATSPSPSTTASATAATLCLPPSAGGPTAPSDAPWVKSVPTEGTLWDDEESYPTTKLSSGTFWAPDDPKQAAPQAFGVLPPELARPVRPRSVEQYELNTPLPQGPPELPVYVVGRYPEEHSDVLKQTLDDVNGWNFIPAFSSLGYGGLPLGEPTTITTSEHAAQRAQAVLRPFLMPDVQPPTVTQVADGGWLVVFNQHVDTYPIYVDRPLAAWVNNKDQVTHIQGRRRPLIEQSTYPLRSAAEAWQLLTQGCGFGFDIYVPQPPKGAMFEAHTVELAYLVVHANAPREIMQPYYVFHNEDGQGLFIPAVADPFVECLEE